VAQAVVVDDMSSSSTPPAAAGAADAFISSDSNHFSPQPIMVAGEVIDHTGYSCFGLALNLRLFLICHIEILSCILFIQLRGQLRTVALPSFYFIWTYSFMYQHEQVVSSPEQTQSPSFKYDSSSAYGDENASGAGAEMAVATAVAVPVQHGYTGNALERTL
jgi:hypothetical protein